MRVMEKQIERKGQFVVGINRVAEDEGGSGEVDVTGGTESSDHASDARRRRRRAAADESAAAGDGTYTSL